MNGRENRCKRSYRAQYDKAVETGTPQSLTTKHNVGGGSPGWIKEGNVRRRRFLWKIDEVWR
jgi:hypothetical protein